MMPRPAGGRWLTAVGLMVTCLALTHASAPARSDIAPSPAGQGLAAASDGQKLSYVDKNGAPTERPLSCSETLPGNGTRAGYALSHGGVVPGTVFVSAGARSMTVGTDVFVDYAGGSLYFAQPVRRTDTIQATYQYVKSQDATRAPLNLSGLTLTLGTTGLNFGYGVSSASGTGLNFTTYGLGITSKLSKSASLAGIAFFSSPSSSAGNRVVEYRDSVTPQTPANPADAKSGHAIVQGLTVTSGKATLKASYQDVALGFSGFQAMRQSYAGNAEALAQIATLEKEQGIRRMGFGLNAAPGKTSAVGLDWNQITDASGAIQTGSFAMATGRFKLNYGTQSVGAGFQAFGNLHDATAAQWAKEHGLSRNTLSMGLDMGRGGALGFSNLSLGDASGGLSRKALNLATKNLNVELMQRTSDAAFNRIGDITDAEKQQLALDIHQQFDPNAMAKNVTAKDIEQIGLDAGLSRQRMSLAGTVDKSSAFQVNQVSISDGKGSIDRTAVGVKTANVTLSYLDQDISDAYQRLGAMSDFEKAQFGNEVGIHRSAIGMNLALNRGSSFAFSQQDVSDKDGALSRESFGYNGKGIQALLNLSDTGSGFARAGDMAGLTDADRQLINTERGYRRLDFTGKLSLIRGVALDAYTYDAHNPSDLLTRGAYRYNLAWAPSKTISATYLTEGTSYTQDAKPVDISDHSALNIIGQLNKSMKFHVVRDVLAQITGGTTVAPVTTNFVHFETDRSKNRNVMAETKLIDYGNGHYEDTYLLDANYFVSKVLNLRFNNTTIDRGADPSLDTNTMLWDWKISPATSFAGSFAETSTNNNQDVTAQSYTVTTPVTSKLNVAGTFSEVDTENTNVKMTKDVALSNRGTFSALGMTQVTLTARFSSVTDQQKLQSEAVGGRVQGFLGKNQLAVEYSGAANPSNTSAVTRSISFVSDRNAKLPFHVDVLYKARNINGSDVQLVRLYNLTYKIGSVMSLTYTYSSLPEAANQVMQPIRSSGLTLTGALTKTLSLSENYSSNYDFSQNVKTNRFATSLTGKLDRLTAIEVGYNVDINTANGLNQNAHTARLSYDTQLSTDQYFSVNGLYTMDHVSNIDDTRLNFDYKTRF